MKFRTVVIVALMSAVVMVSFYCLIRWSITGEEVLLEGEKISFSTQRVDHFKVEGERPWNIRAASVRFFRDDFNESFIPRRVDPDFGWAGSRFIATGRHEGVGTPVVYKLISLKPTWSIDVELESEESLSVRLTYNRIIKFFEQLVTLVVHFTLFGLLSAFIIVRLREKKDEE